MWWRILECVSYIRRALSSAVLASLIVRPMSETKILLIPIMFAACAGIVLADAKPDLTGSYVHKSGSDREAISISVTVEAKADGKFMFSLMAAHPDAHGAAPDGEGEGSIDRDGVFHFTFEDSFSNKGTGTFRRTRKGYLLSIRIDQVKEPRCLEFYGEHVFQRDPRKKPWRLTRNTPRGF